MTALIMPAPSASARAVTLSVNVAGTPYTGIATMEVPNVPTLVLCPFTVPSNLTAASALTLQISIASMSNNESHYVLQTGVFPGNNVAFSCEGGFGVGSYRYLNYSSGALYQIE
jgi:hypothetical protein